VSRNGKKTRKANYEQKQMDTRWREKESDFFVSGTAFDTIMNQYGKKENDPFKDWEATELPDKNPKPQPESMLDDNAFVIDSSEPETAVKELEAKEEKPESFDFGGIPKAPESVGEFVGNQNDRETETEMDEEPPFDEFDAVVHFAASDNPGSPVSTWAAFVKLSGYGGFSMSRTNVSFDDDSAVLAGATQIASILMSKFDAYKVKVVCSEKIEKCLKENATRLADGDVAIRRAYIRIAEEVRKTMFVVFERPENASPEMNYVDGLLASPVAQV